MFSSRLFSGSVRTVLAFWREIRGEESGRLCACARVRHVARVPHLCHRADTAVQRRQGTCRHAGVCALCASGVRTLYGKRDAGEDVMRGLRSLPGAPYFSMNCATAHGHPRGYVPDHVTTARISFVSKFLTWAARAPPVSMKTSLAIERAARCLI